MRVTMEAKTVYGDWRRRRVSLLHGVATVRLDGVRWLMFGPGHIPGCQVGIRVDAADAADHVVRVTVDISEDIGGERDPMFVRVRGHCAGKEKFGFEQVQKMYCRLCGKEVARPLCDACHTTASVGLQTRELAKPVGAGTVWAAPPLGGSGYDVGVVLTAQTGLLVRRSGTGSAHLVWWTGQSLGSIISDNLPVFHKANAKT